MQDRMLLQVTQITDDSTGCYSVGELNFGISGTLDTYLEKHGIKGRDELTSMLGFLIHRVHEYSNKIEEKKYFAQTKQGNSAG